jgi:hypothetical protein
MDLEAVEMATREAVHKMGAGILTALLREEPPKERVRECGCGGQAKYIEQRPKQILTAVGPASILRAYYLCRSCHTGQAPTDKEIDVEGTEFSPGVRRMMALVGGQTSFDSGRQQMEWLAGLKVTAKSVERTAEAIGADIAKREQDRICASNQVNETVSQSEGEEIPIAYVEIDASGIPVVTSEIDSSRPGKQGDRQRTKEAKIGCVFTQTATDEQGRPIRDESSTTYTTAIEDSHEFGWRIYTEAIRRGIDRAKKVVVIGDGAPWIWILVKMHFPGAIEILDLYHARQHLWDLAAKLFPINEIERKRWVKRFQHKLDNGKIKQLVADLRSMEVAGEVLRDAVRIQADYFERNAHRMQYPLFRSQGLFVGSGVIEAACKTVIGSRFKQSGMFWTIRGANSILALRAIQISGQFEDYWEARAA